MRKKLIMIVLFLCVMLMATACGKDTTNNATTPTAVATPTTEATKAPEATPTPETTPTAEATPTPEATPTTAQTADPGKVLVVVFSATGNTKKVAEMIAKIENADLYEIVPAVPYTSEDINYGNYNCRALKEQGDASARPEIGSDAIDISGYTKIYVGYPIWAGSEPRIMDTFVESYDFGTATVIPFCTSGSSGIGTTGTKLGTLAGSGNWQSGKRFPGSATEQDVQAWIDSMKQ
ncbi:MAG: flavodoxin [Lachnospiraceae bacterium]|nr:flavodoxin [Lachnospiraceae bacterium]MBP5463017.1 flavodoxin [Lachnospiraceae bacterium]